MCLANQPGDIPDKDGNAQVTYKELFAVIDETNPISIKDIVHGGRALEKSGVLAPSSCCAIIEVINQSLNLL
jgi:hypothetical protein